MASGSTRPARSRAAVTRRKAGRNKHSARWVLWRPNPVSRSVQPPMSPGGPLIARAGPPGLPYHDGVLKITPLTNFQARIVQDAVLDDGERQQREFGIEAALGGATVSFSVSAAEFGRMGWVLSQLGSQAIIYGQHQHAR